MSLEAQVSNLVSATTTLTNTVNNELTKVRNENTDFKADVLDSIDTRFNGFNFIETGFTVYVAASGGSSSPANPINNQVQPFDTINNAYKFVCKYHWTHGAAVIQLLPGTHLMLTRIDVSHPCPIRITGSNSPDFTNFENLLGQTTSANREGASNVSGSNASLLLQAKSLYNSVLEIDIPLDQEAAFVVNNNLHLSNLLIYQKNLGRSLFGVYLGRFNLGGNVPGFSCASLTLMYFSVGVMGYNGAINFQRYRSNYFLGNGSAGIVLYNTQFTNKGEVFYCNGNTGNGLTSYNSFLSISSGVFRGNGQHGVLSHTSNLFGDLSTFNSNGGNGLYQSGGDARILTASAQNNGGFGFRSDCGVIYAVGSDPNITGNTSGKKFENNAQQGFVIGVNV